MIQQKLWMSGLAIGESPRWHNNRLWFCNWGTGEIIAVGLDSSSEVIAKVQTTFPFSIDWLPDGRLLVVSGPEKILLRQEPDGHFVTHADLAGMAGGCNELVVDGRGNIYVNASGPDPAPGQQFAPGVIILITPDGKMKKVAGGLAFPNGMAITPDNATLI